MGINIFEIIENVTSRIEPFHSEFLARSFQNSRELLNRFIRLLLSKNIDDSIRKLLDAKDVIIKSEETFEDYRRIDITIQEPISKIIIGIEVKTTDSSVSKNQLTLYYTNLVQKYRDHNVIIVFLTPFNHENIPDTALSTLCNASIEFADFKKQFQNSVHINWKDVIDLYDSSFNAENILLAQHKDYISSRVINKSLVIRRADSLARNRGLAEFLGQECIERFFNKLFKNDIKYLETDNQIIFKLEDSKAYYDNLIDSLLILIDSGTLQKNSKKQNKVSKDLINKYEQGPYSEFFNSLFSSINNYSYVWLEGEGRIGVRASHKLHKSSGVSIFTMDKKNIIIQKHR